MALFGHGAMSDLSPLLGVKRKLDFGAVRAAFDPQRTLDVWPHLRFGRPWALSRTAAGAVMLPSPSKPRNCSA